jgi:ethanolamine utilization protein EutA (predicted chaperonin)
MKCLACSAEMRLTDVRPDRTTVCGIERHTFRCSACTHTAQRLMLNRVRMPITNLPVVTPKAPVIDQHNGRPAAQSAWAKSIEKVKNKQAELKQRAAAATDWASVVEKLSIRLKQQAVAARAEALARTVEKLRSRHTGLPVRITDSEFDRVWYGHCPDEAAPKPVALGPEPLRDDGAT